MTFRRVADRSTPCKLFEDAWPDASSPAVTLGVADHPSAVATTHSEVSQPARVHRMSHQSVNDHASHSPHHRLASPLVHPPLGRAGAFSRSHRAKARSSNLCECERRVDRSRRRSVAPAALPARSTTSDVVFLIAAVHVCSRPNIAAPVIPRLGHFG